MPARALVALVLAASTFLATLPALAQDTPPRGIPRSAERATVRAVVDGDTIRVTLAGGAKDTVRLIGIDTPETKAPGEPVGCYGPEASDRLAQLLPAGREVWLESDETDRDRYDRLLRYVWVAKSDGGRYLVNEVMVRDGYGLAYRFPPDEARLERIEAAQERASAAGRGLWSACPDFVVALTPVPTPAPAPTEVPYVAPTEAPYVPPVVDTAPAPVASGCDPSYPTLCLQSFPDLDCPQVGASDFIVYPPDPHGFDRDRDGIGCES